METINNKYKQLVKEIKWRFKETDYKDSDKLQVCIHETIDKDVSFISIAEVEKLSNELGVSKILEIEKSYIEEFEELTEKAIKDPINKLRLLLYWYFERRFYDEEQNFININEVENE